ncbi:hypothetical protein M0805_000370 [Coniferiporia weirii]|nr:hypothetical protein M0805_000370 [Coniferiporia weirii]
MASHGRTELVQNAIAFLMDPKSQTSTLAQRIQFLEAKGLTSSEIEEVIRQASMKQNVTMQTQPPPYHSPYQYGPPVYPPQARQPMDWRDYFIMAVVSGTFVYGAVTLARKFLMPHLQPPSSTAYEADRDALTEQFDAAEALLKEIQAETAAVRQAVEEQKVKVEQTTQDVDECVKEMRQGEVKTRDEMREIREEVNSIREMLPKMIEKNKESQTQSLSELQQELKSLKALLLSRGPSYPSTPSPSFPSFVGRPSIPAWQLAGASNVDSGAGAGGSAIPQASASVNPTEEGSSKDTLPPFSETP